MADHAAALEFATLVIENGKNKDLLTLAAAYLELRELIAGYMFNDDADELARIRRALRAALGEDHGL